MYRPSKYNKHNESLENFAKLFNDEQSQTIGRIRRMPEADHYDNAQLDYCYIYTLDKAFIEYAKKESGAHEVKKVFIKPEHKAFRLTKELKSVNYFENNPVILLKTAHAFFTKKYELTTGVKANRTAFEVRGKYKFDENILYDSQQGTMIVTDNQEHVHELALSRKLSTHSDGRLFHHCVGEIADAAGVKYDSMVIILRRLFDEGVKYSNKLLSLPTKHLYAFVINNKALLKADFKESSHSGIQGVISTSQKNTVEFAFPQECVIQYTPNSYKECKKNIYDGYLLSKATKSKVEREFEKWCEKNSDWFYKNGDKGNEYFSILYTNEYGKQKLFYPDYILSINGEIWIIETKGGITYSGADANIDDFSEKKFNALKEYVAKYNLKGGFVVLDENGLDDELYISTSMFHKIKDDRSEYTLLEDYFN